MNDDEPRDYEDPLGIRSRGEPDTPLGQRVEVFAAYSGKGDRAGPMTLVIRQYPGQPRVLWASRECRSTQAYVMFRKAGLLDMEFKNFIPVYAEVTNKRISKMEVLIDEDFHEKGALLAAMVMKS